MPTINVKMTQLSKPKKGKKVKRRALSYRATHRAGKRRNQSVNLSVNYAFYKDGGIKFSEAESGERGNQPNDDYGNFC